MTAMLASVTDVEEAEIAIAGGADIIDLKDSARGALAGLPTNLVAEIVGRIAGSRATSAVLGVFPANSIDPAIAVGAIAATGVDYIKTGFLPGADVASIARRLTENAAGKRLIAVFFADLEKDPAPLVAVVAEAGFSGVMLDTAGKDSGRLLVHADIGALQAFVGAARKHGLLVGLAGGLEAPDVPRLLTLKPDFLGFRGALCAGHDRRARLDLRSVNAIRRLIPREAAGSARVDYRFLQARDDYWAPAGGDQATDRIYVRDLVLPVRIGAYSHERAAAQKVRFDVSVDIARGRVEPSAMGEVFSYDLIADAISANIAVGHIDLVETLAERIGRDLLRHPRARRVTIRIEKLEVGPGALGVEIVRERPDLLAEQNPVLAMIEGGWRKPRA